MIKELEMRRAGWIVWVCSHSVLVREAGQNIRGRDRERRRERSEDPMLLALKLEEGTLSQEVQAGSNCWKRQRDTFSPSLQKEHGPTQNCEVLSSLL